MELPSQKTIVPKWKILYDRYNLAVLVGIGMFGVLVVSCALLHGTVDVLN
jgi:carbon starvation protein CstA